MLWPTGEYLLFSKLVPFYNPMAMVQVENAGPIKWGKMTYYTTAVSAGAAYEVGSIATGYTFDGTTQSTSKAAGSIYAMVADTDRCGRLAILEDGSSIGPIRSSTCRCRSRTPLGLQDGCRRQQRWTHQCLRR